jgi:hypothetical protein
MTPNNFGTITAYTSCIKRAFFGDGYPSEDLAGLVAMYSEDFVSLMLVQDISERLPI